MHQGIYRRRPIDSLHSRPRDDGPRRLQPRGVLRALVPLVLLAVLRPSPVGAGSIGFVRDTSGDFTTFDVPRSTETYVFALNNSGEAAGWYRDASHIGHGFLRDATGAITTFDPLGSTLTIVAGLNDHGVAAGSFDDASGTHGFLRSASGAITTFDVPGLSDCPIRGTSGGRAS